MSTSLTTTPYANDPGEARNYCLPVQLKIYARTGVLYDLRYMVLPTRDSHNPFQMEPSLRRLVAATSG